MKKNNNYYLKSILALCVVFLLIPFLVINANPKPTPKLDAAVGSGEDTALIGKHSVWGIKEDVVSAANQIMERLLSELGDLSGLLRTTDNAIAAAALEYVASLGDLSPGSAAANMAQIVSGIRDKASLESAIESKEYEIHNQVFNVKSADTARNTALSDLHTYITNTYNSNGTPSDDLELPDPIHTPLIRQFTCRGNCTDKFDSPVYARVSHRFPCRYKPHNDITHNPFVYYDCPSVTTDDVCPRSGEHWVECRRCNDLCPPPVLVVHGKGPFGEVSTEYRDHEKVCQEEAKKLIGWGTCNERYFTCQTTVCPNDGNHKVAGACGKSGHYEKKCDANAIAKHARINMQCPSNIHIPVAQKFNVR